MEIDLNHRNAILESAALVAEQIDSCREHTYDNGATADGYRQAKNQIADAIRALKTGTTKSDVATCIGGQTVHDPRPYGEWCRDPAACAGKGYCPLDPTCGD
jgi:hypothetical protein